jgi:hypothetical protein
MSAEVTIREGRDIRELFGSGRGTWAGVGAAALGLTGDVRPEDFEVLSELVADEDDEGLRQEKTAERTSLIEQMRRDGTL